MTKNHNGAQSRNDIITDAELNFVVGGDKATTTTKDTKTTTPPIKPIVFTLEQVLVSSY